MNKIYNINKISQYHYAIMTLFMLRWQSMNIGDTIYRMDWPLLSISEKKGLLMIMIRSTIPIKFTSSFLITLSLQSYSNVSIIITLGGGGCQNKYLIYNILIYNLRNK